MSSILIISEHMGAENSYPFVRKVFDNRKEANEELDIEFHSLRATPNEPEETDELFLSPNTSKLDPRAVLELRNHIKKQNTDAVYASSLRAQLFCVFLKLLYKPSLDIFARVTGRIFRDDKWYEFLLRQLQSQIDYFVAPSKTSREKLVKIGILDQNTVIHYNFLDSDDFNPENYFPAREKDRLGISGDPVIGFVGRLINLKNVDIILKGFNQLLADHPDATLLIVGDGPLRTELEKLARKLGMEDSVQFMGYREDVPEIISTLNIGVLISEYESFGMPIIEFLRMGCPVVATDVGVASEVETYLISDSRPKLLYLALKKVVDADHQTATGSLERFEVEKFFEELENIIKTNKS